MLAEKQFNVPDTIKKGIFRAYDIRGVVGDGIDADTIYAVGLAIGAEVKQLGQTKIVVGRDARKSSPELINALQHGLLSCGLDVIDIGEVSSPVLYFSTFHLSIPSGVMLTASHNPPNYNGLKILIDGTTLTEERIMALHDRINCADFISEAPGQLIAQDVLPAYLDRICQDVKLARPLKIVIDCGNGIAGKITPALFKRLGCEVIELFCDVDGSFPNHEPDPSVAANMVDLQQKVLETGADIGLGFDGDADRIGVVTEKGDIIWPDQQMLLFAKDVLSRNPGAPIIFDVKCTANLAKQITAWGGKPIMWQTGHSLVKKKLYEEQAPLAGEMSGHIFFLERWYGFDDGAYVAARLLEIIASSNDTVSEVFSQFPQTVNTPEIKLAISDEQKFSFMEHFAKEADFSDANIIRIDGLRIEWPFGWGLVRASNTSPCLTLRFEADSEENLEKVKLRIVSELERLGDWEAINL